MLKRVAATPADNDEATQQREPDSLLSQWVLSVPRRLRYYLQHDPAIETLALRIFLSIVEQALRRTCPAAGFDLAATPDESPCAPTLGDAGR
jgi:hypothetical protein